VKCCALELFGLRAQIRDYFKIINKIVRPNYFKLNIIFSLTGLPGIYIKMICNKKYKNSCVCPFSHARRPFSAYLFERVSTSRSLPFFPTLLANLYQIEKA